MVDVADEGVARMWAGKVAGSVRLAAPGATSLQAAASGRVGHGQPRGTGDSLTGVIVLVHRVKPGHRNFWSASTSSASTT